jgi:spore maturation protein B
MQILMYFSDFCIPLLLFYLIGYGLLTKTDIYKEFTEGAKDGFHVTIGILPP